jgi:glyoxylase-like metal-dependent hydrolase (beta-lactamase superfamily II)
MIGLELPPVDVWSERVTVALGQNPGIFTGPGTNTYLVGTGRERILLDTGEGRPEYLSVLADAIDRVGGVHIQEIVLTHGHPDHMGGVASVMERWGPKRVSKHAWPAVDARAPFELEILEDGAVIETEGATLRAIHTPGHAEDHLCFVLEEERAIFSGDNILGVGTTVIPGEGGCLLSYMTSLERLRAEEPGAIYPAHGPCIGDGAAKVDEYIAHRLEREDQILAALDAGRALVSEIVEQVYAAYPKALHAAAAASVTAHLVKLEKESRVRREGGPAPLDARWVRT